mmetsp:Transcript_39335/g.83815  ORF Transcript_39335/g.83815 Transcript_39335/m.83815 type:complete len:262 (+) Transcript_39335:2195-2980(+)
MAGQLACQAVRRPCLQGRRQDRLEAACRESLRPRAPSRGHARHHRHDARRCPSKQGKDYPAALVRGLEMLEGQHPLEGAWLACPHREHDPQIRQVQGRLVDQRHLLQPRANSTRCHRRQDHVQEELGPIDPIVVEGRTGATAQLPQGWTIRQWRGGCGDLHHNCPLARVAKVHAHPLPSSQLQARHQAPHPGPRASQGAVHCPDQVEPDPARRVGFGRAGLRQSSRGSQSNQEALADSASLQGSHHRVPGHVFPLDALLRD